MRRGFTLVEILVAMSILGVLVLVMAQIFVASTTAWTGGLRQVEMNMEGRAAINLISIELSQALTDDRLPVTMAPESLEFYTAVHPVVDAGAPINSSRAIKQVRYSRAGDKLRRQVRPVRPVANVYPAAAAWSAAADMVGNVANFRVVTSPGWAGPTTTNLPHWVELQLVLEDTSGQARVRVWSYGEDEEDGTDKDIKSWRE